MIRIIILISIFYSGLFSQASDPAMVSSRWIAKISPTDYNKLNLDKQDKNSTYTSTIQLRKISDYYQLVGVTTVEPITKVEAVSLLLPMKVVDIYRDAKLTQRETTPDDFKYENQWNMRIIDMPKVWDHLKGGQTSTGEDIVIAVLDIGFQPDHIDIEENLFFNTQEIPDDGIDNDNNGYVDDYLGCNVVTKNGKHFIDDHGTKVAGIIGAKGNNGRGVAGINWHTKLMLISGVDQISDIYVAIEYLIMMKQRYLDTDGREGANVVVSNMSAGVDFDFPDEYPEWCSFYDRAGDAGIISVTAATNKEVDVETRGDMPSLCPSDFLLTVTNTDMTDSKVLLSGRGAVSIDLGAPGERVYTTTIGDDYSFIIGTSGSAPHVAGVAGLLYSMECSKFSALLRDDPRATALLIIDAIKDGADSKSSLAESVTGGRLNGFNSFLNLEAWCTGISQSKLKITNISQENGRLIVGYSTNDFEKHELYLRNSIGEIVTKVEFLPTIFQSKEVVLNTDSLPVGMYFATIYTGTDQVTSSIGIIKN